MYLPITYQPLQALICDFRLSSERGLVREYPLTCFLPANAVLLHVYIGLWLLTLLSAAHTLRQLMRLIMELSVLDERKTRDDVLQWLVGLRSHKHTPST